MSDEEKLPTGQPAEDAPELELEWVSNDLSAEREAQATIRESYQITLNVLGTREAMAAFSSSGTDPMPEKVSAGWLGKRLVISSRQFPGTVPFSCRWTVGANPALSLHLARVLKRRGIRVPAGFVYRVPVSVFASSEFGPLLSLDLEQPAVDPVDSREVAAGRQGEAGTPVED